MRHATPTEHDEQKTVISWRNQMLNMEPRLAMLIAIPNAAKRSYRLASYMKSEGLAKGFPDLALLCKNDLYAGLFIEMKTQRGKPTSEQLEWLCALRNHGYAAIVCYGADETIRIIKTYLGIR